MANFLSQRQEFNKVQDPVNINLINTVLSAKQGKFDEGIAAIDSSLAELGRIDGMLLRQSDREYLANNVKSLLDTVNTSGKLDLSNSGVTRNIQNQIKSALDSKVINAVSQGNKITSFQATIAEKQKSKPELYSDVNYQYALKQAGVQQYLNGETDSVGNLSYDDYVNAPKILDESISKWAKDYGYKTEYTQGDTNQLIYTNEKREILTKNDIVNKLKTSLDPKLSKQLQIDADYHYTNKPKGQITIDADNYYTKQNAEIDLQLVRIKAARVGETEAQKVIYDNNEKYYLELKEGNNKKLIDKDFDNDYQKYEVYSTSLFDNIADNYDRNDVVDIKYVDTNLKVAEFNADIEYKKASLDQGQQRIDIAKQAASAADLANVISSGGTPGSITDRPDTTAGTKTNSQIATEKHNTDYQNLKTSLETSSVEYNELESPEEKEQFIKDLASTNTSVSINNDKLSPEVRENLDVYRASYITIKSNRQNIVNKVGNSIINGYNSLIGSNTNFTNLSKTAPLTAKAAASGISLEKLPKQDVAAIKHEMAINTLNFDDTLSDEERSTLTIYAKNLEQQSYLTPQQSKAMRDKDRQKIGFGEGQGDIIANDASIVGNALGWGVKSIFNLFDNDPTSQSKTNDEYFNSRDKLVVENSRIRDRMDKRSLDVGFGYQDSNLTEIEMGDLRKGATADLSTTIRTAVTTVTRNSEEEYKKIIENTKDLRSISFNPEDKKQVAYTTAIKTQLSALSDLPVEQAKGSVFETTLSQDGNTIVVRYIPKDTTEKITSTIPAASIPALASALTDRSSSFTNSKLNRNAPARRMTYETPVDSKSREDLLYKLYSMYGENILPEKEMIRQSQQGSSMPTQIEFRSLAERQTPEVAQQINQISTAVFDVVWTPTGSGWRGTVKDEENNIIEIAGGQAEVVLSRDYDEGGMRLAAIDLINKVKIAKISKLIEK